MQADRIAGAIQRFVMHPEERVTKVYDLRERVVVLADDVRYEAFPARWRIQDEAWVDDALLVFTSLGVTHLELYYGLLFERDGGEHFLNDRVVLAGLGARLATGLDPLAYAELLAALYTDDKGERAVHRSGRPGYLIDEPEEFWSRYPEVDPGLISAPVVRREGDTTVLEFLSSRRHPVGLTLLLDVVAWTVTVPDGGPATWTRRSVVRRQPLRPRRASPRS
ncbi:hypothetical protein GCM10023322_39860 [Rugosimonospora acidiphila]|uniref:Uncharacterized protein n=1 Tax=Rugosimonospora acidiphila TaxID=556531 RepID=A0ABP9RYH9_9ACTN